MEKALYKLNTLILLTTVRHRHSPLRRFALLITLLRSWRGHFESVSCITSTHSTWRGQWRRTDRWPNCRRWNSATTAAADGCQWKLQWRNGDDDGAHPPSFGCSRASLQVQNGDEFIGPHKRNKSATIPIGGSTFLGRKLPGFRLVDFVGD